VFINQEVISMCVAAKRISAEDVAVHLHHTSVSLKNNLKDLHKRLGRQPTPDEVEALLKEMELQYERHAPFNVFGLAANHKAHSFGVRVKDQRLYICESMDDSRWAVL
jgi:hypothetical protein